MDLGAGLSARCDGPGRADRLPADPEEALAVAAARLDDLERRCERERCAIESALHPRPWKEWKLAQIERRRQERRRALVESLHDGMNQVAKEFPASRDALEGVLVLLSFTGAARELREAVIGDPGEARAMGEGIARAFAATKAEQRARLRLVREMARARNVYRWAAEMLLDAAKLRQRSRILEMLSKKAVGRRIAAAA